MLDSKTDSIVALAQVPNPCFEKPFDFGEVIERVLAGRQAT